MMSFLRCFLVLAWWVALPCWAQTVEYIHTDALGSPVAVTDANGAVLERSEYEPYGSLLNRPVDDRPGFTGHVMDAATGLSYMQQRYYDPTIGRFLSVDPVAANPNTGASFNRYWYANNNPYKFTDPDGRQSCIQAYCGGGGKSDQTPNPQQARMQGVRESGKVGERLNGIKPGDLRERIPSRTGTAAYRVTDKSDAKTIREVKNVSRLDRITNQMKDFVADAKATMRDLVYSVREDTVIGKAVDSFFSENGVKIDRNLPTLENQPTMRQLESMPEPMVRPMIEAPPPVVRVPMEPLIIP